MEKCCGSGERHDVVRVVSFFGWVGWILDFCDSVGTDWVSWKREGVLKLKGSLTARRFLVSQGGVGRVKFGWRSIGSFECTRSMAPSVSDRSSDPPISS